MRQRDEEGDPVVSMFFEPPGLGVSSAYMGWDDTDTGWNYQEKFFDEITLDYIGQWIDSLKLGELWKK